MLDLLIFLVQVQLTFWVNQECHQFCSQYKPSCNHFIFWFIKQGLAPPPRRLAHLTWKHCQLSLYTGNSLLLVSVQIQLYCQIHNRHWVVFLTCTSSVSVTGLLTYPDLTAAKIEAEILYISMTLDNRSSCWVDANNVTVETPDMGASKSIKRVAQCLQQAAGNERGGQRHDGRLCCATWHLVWIWAIRELFNQLFRPGWHATTSFTAQFEPRLRQADECHSKNTFFFFPLKWKGYSYNYGWVLPATLQSYLIFVNRKMKTKQHSLYSQARVYRVLPVLNCHTWFLPLRDMKSTKNWYEICWFLSALGLSITSHAACWYWALFILLFTKPDAITWMLEHVNALVEVWWVASTPMDKWDLQGFSMNIDIEMGFCKKLNKAMKNWSCKHLYFFNSSAHFRVIFICTWTFDGNSEF